MSNPDKRFLSERAKREEKAFLDAARNYMGAMSGLELDWLYRKPYDNRPGNEQFYLQAYAVMNLVRAMDIRHGGRILEVGSGPGWVSELLMLLGYDVDGIEPSADLVAVARERVERAAAHYRLPSTPNVVFHETTIESVDFELETFDAVLFHDALHHVIDERVTLETCARVLKPGGVLGIGEDAWQPGNREQESALEEEIDRFGTHESPFTCEYLDELLESCGFRDVIRYHAVNGLFPEEMGATAIAEAAQSRAEHSNTLVARKTTFDGPTSADAEAATRARIEIAGARFEPRDRKITISVKLTNTGDTVWLHRPRAAGWVSIALRSTPLDAPDYHEARPRHRLPRELPPGEALKLELDFFLDADADTSSLCLDLVNEGLFWFSQRGTEAAPFTLA